LLDNPSLTVRNWSGKSPIRVAIDRLGRIPTDFNLLDGKISTIVFSEKKRQSLENLEYINISFDEHCLKNILNILYELDIHSVLVEGGASILKSFIQLGLWDEANIEIAPFKILEGVKAPILDRIPITNKNYNGHQWLFFKNN